MPEEQTLEDPGVELAITLLNKAMNGGGVSIDIDKALYALGEAAKANLRISCKNNIKISRHIDDDDVHTPKGILVRSSVIGWFLLLVVIVSTIVMYIPDLIAWIKLP